MISGTDISNALNSKGFAIFSVPSKAEAITVFGHLGRVVLETEVRIRENPGTYLSSCDTVPFHNDHPRVKYIAWYCVEQDLVGGESLLVDMQQVVSRLTQCDRAGLAKIRMSCPELRSIIPSSEYPLYQESTGQVFWAPWLLPETRSASDKELICRILGEIESPSNRTQVRLRAGEVLLVDNHRLAHGRESICRFSQRNLMRYWLCEDA